MNVINITIAGDELKYGDGLCDQIVDSALSNEDYSEKDVSCYLNEPIENIHEMMGCRGDNLICNRMKYLGMQTQWADEIRNQKNSNSIREIYKEELDEAESREWWNDPRLEKTTGW